MTAFEKAWAYLKADFSDIAGGQGLSGSNAGFYAEMTNDPRLSPEHAREVEQMAIDNLISELTEEDLARLFHGQNYDPYIHRSPLQLNRQYTLQPENFTNYRITPHTISPYEE